jgi:hypothetical protein
VIEAEMASHAERRYELVTERMKAVAEIQVTLQQARKESAAADRSELQNAALAEALKQTDELRRELQGAENDIHQALDHVRRQAAWAQALENGYGYSPTFPKQNWTAFLALLAYLPADDRKALRALPLPETLGAVVRPNGGTVEGYAPAAATFGDLIGEMMEASLYPKVATPLHALFTDEVFPRIAKALAGVEADAAKRIAELFERRAKAIQQLYEQSK